MSDFPRDGYGPTPLSLDDELEALQLRARLHGELDELDIDGPIRAEMTSEPERALRLIARARRRRPRSLAGFVVSLWRRRDPAPPPAPGLRREPEREPERAPPTLDAIEYHWSLDSVFVLAVMAVAIQRDGGLGYLREQAAEPGRPFTDEELGLDSG